ncbi:MAG TPA: DUF1659 domain-containing protein [Eubacteriaceae bacterium]|jgi:hypothetical protein|nr:DUF1659 domain-containing protein [Eubacteriaceae bacterium]
MAIEEYAFSTRLQLKLLTGFDEEGKEIFRTKTYSNVKPSAENQSIYDVANTLAGLQKYELEEIHRVEDVILLNA